MVCAERRRLNGLVAVLAVTLAGVGVAIVYGLARPTVEPLSMMEFLPIDLLGAVAVVDAEVAAVEGLDDHQELLILDNVEVRWRLEQARLHDGELHPVPSIDEGRPLVVRSWTQHDYVVGERYHLFLINAFDVERPGSQWRSQLALRVTDQAPVEGVQEGTIEELRSLLRPDEEPASDTFRALLEFAIEQRAALEARNAGRSEPPPGPRTKRLEAFRAPPARDPLEEWMDVPARERPLGTKAADIPDGAAEVLDVDWVDALALVAHDPADVQEVEKMVVLTPHGRGVPFALNPDMDATLFPFVRARGATMTIASWTGEDTRPRPLTGRLRNVVRALDEGGGLFIDLRGSGIEVEALPPDEFDELVLELRP